MCVISLYRPIMKNCDRKRKRELLRASQAICYLCKTQCSISFHLFVCLFVCMFICFCGHLQKRMKNCDRKWKRELLRASQAISYLCKTQCDICVFVCLFVYLFVSFSLFLCLFVYLFVCFLVFCLCGCLQRQ